jgi:hypothetical protein
VYICTVGWVDIGIRTKGKRRSVVSLAKVWEIGKKSFLNQSTFIAEGITFRVIQYSREGSKHFFLINIGFMGIKISRILRGFQKL